MMKSCAKAKLLLFGEHSAVYGYTAIGVSLPLTLSLSLTETPNKHPSLVEQFPQILAFFPELIEHPKLFVEVHSEIPIGCGFGSSGALCVALARALLQRFPREHFFPKDLWAIAHDLEKTFHGTPSGIDTGLSCFERPCIFNPGREQLPNVTFIEEPLPPFVFGFVPRKTSTADLIAGLRQRYEKNLTVQKTIEKLGKITEEAKSCLGSAQKLGVLANIAHEHLQSLSLSTPELDETLAEGRKLGATGGKLSGAGGGGAYILFAETYEEATLIAKRLKAFT